MQKPDVIDEDSALSLCRRGGGCVIAKTEPKNPDRLPVVEIVDRSGKRYECSTENPEAFPKP